MDETSENDLQTERKFNRDNREVKIPFIKSFSVKVTGIIAVVCIVTAALILLSVIPATKEQTEQLVKDYMTDIVEQLGASVDGAVNMDADSLNESLLKTVCEGISIAGMDSSYAYAVDRDGTMLYHPTESKIGSPVENTTIQEVVAQNQAGTAKELAWVSYYYNGTYKYAAYAIAADGECIVIITADKSDAMSTVTSSIRNSIIKAFAIAIVMCIGGFFVSRSISKPIMGVAKAVRKLSNLELKEDDYTRKIAERGDEIGFMARGVEKLTDNLIEVVGVIQQQSNNLFETANKLSENATETVNSVHQVEIAVSEVAEGASSQAEETTSATESVITMGDMIARTNEQVGILREASKAIEAAAVEANGILNDLLQINQAASGSIDMIHERTNTTNQSVEEIKKAIEIIASIAEETNLLSLNASIEAARAGEQGRGFAVVATQIQKLAEQSNDSANQISAVIEKLIEDSNQSVAGMEEVKGIMVKQTEYVKNTGSAFAHVKDNIDETVRGLGEIATKSADLDHARETVTDSVQNLSAIAQENAASSEESSASVTEVCNIMDKITADTVKLKDISKQIDDYLHEFMI